MHVRRTIVPLLLLALPGARAVAQPDVHARAVARTTCQSGKQSPTVTQAAAAVERDPDDLAPRMRLADALVDQGCYQEAVGVLEAGQEAHPRSRELAGKLRDVRSLVTEQTYIEGLTQAAEAAKFQRNQLRCTRLADLAACEDALKIKPADQQLLAAKEAAMKAKLAATQSVGIAPAAGIPQTTDPAQAAGTLQAARAPRAKRPKGQPRPPAASLVEAPSAALASPEPSRTYSNEAPPGQTN